MMKRNTFLRDFLRVRYDNIFIQRPKHKHKNLFGGYSKNGVDKHSNSWKSIRIVFSFCLLLISQYEGNIFLF